MLEPAIKESKGRESAKRESAKRESAKRVTAKHSKEKGAVTKPVAKEYYHLLAEKMEEMQANRKQG